MFDEEKSKAYQKLVKKSQDDYRNNPDKHKSGNVTLAAPDIKVGVVNGKVNFTDKDRSFCKEINLYTYWQGFNYAKNTPKIKYLLVGQDWGNPFNLQSPFMQRIIKMNHGDESVKYYDEKDNTYVTDKHLVELFAVLGYDIANKRYPELFFTNFCLGYRTGNESGDMSEKLMRNDMEYFKRLCDILEPKNILCLGKTTFACAYETLTGKKASEFDDFKDNFNEFIKNNTSYSVQCGTKESRIYPLAHCGNGGTLSRNKILKDGKWVYDDSLPKDDPLSLQKQDWERIKG